MKGIAISSWLLATVLILASSSLANSKLSLIAECQRLVNSADCRFYDCIEKVVPCGESGYVQGYGRRYCYRFLSVLHKFTPQGKLFVANTRRCLIRNLYSFYKTNKGETNCPEIKKFAFNSHSPCYLTGSPNFCEIIANPSNYNALLSGYQIADFFGNDVHIALRQVGQTGSGCLRKSNDRVKEAIGGMISTLKDSFLSLWQT